MFRVFLKFKRKNGKALLLFSAFVFSCVPFIVSIQWVSQPTVFVAESVSQPTVFEVESVVDGIDGLNVTLFLTAREYGKLSHLYRSSHEYRRSTKAPTRHYSRSKNQFVDDFLPSPDCLNWTVEKENHCTGHICKSTTATISQIDPLTSNGQSCKTLWFAGFSICGNTCEKTGYIMDYAVALQSAILHASNVLQPVLLLGRYGCKNKKIPEIAEWAFANGAVVVVVDQLSFQKLVDLRLAQNSPVELSMGPYLRLDIPAFVKRHELMSLPLVCDRHALYTDSDIIFVNQLTHSDIQGLRELAGDSSDAYVVYGRETNITGPPFNTGVMMIDVPRFDTDWPNILKFGITNGPFSAHDQGWLNQYFQSSPARLKNRTMLSNHWNWKTYWQVLPSMWGQLKIVHLHGPKPGNGLFEMSTCCTSRKSLLQFPRSYRRLIRNGICCNRGRTASLVIKLFTALSPPLDAIC